MIWTTESIKEYDNNPKIITRESKIDSILQNNKDKFKSPYFNDIKGLRKSIKFKNSEDEIEYLLKLKNNPKLIDRNIQLNLNGQTSILRFTGIQEEIIDSIHNNKFSVLSTSRQIGSSMVIFSYILYYLSVNNSKTILVISDKNSDIDKFVSLYKSLDFFIKPGIHKMNKFQIYFDNGNSIIFKKSGKDKLFKGPSTNFDLIFLLNFAFQDNSENILKYIMIYSNCISSRVIVQSQPNKKDDTFAKLFLNDDKIWYRRKFTSSLIDENIIKKIGISSYLKEYLCLFPESKEYNRLSNIYKILE